MWDSYPMPRASGKDRNHFTIVGRMMRDADDPQRAAIVDFVKKGCAELLPSAVNPIAPLRHAPRLTHAG